MKYSHRDIFPRYHEKLKQSSNLHKIIQFRLGNYFNKFLLHGDGTSPTLPPVALSPQGVPILMKSGRRRVRLSILAMKILKDLNILILQLEKDFHYARSLPQE